jgi:uncharacterized protein
MADLFRVLSLSDVVIPFIYSPLIKEHFSEVDFVISCGDLPHYYLEYIASSLDVPLFFVKGNHAREMEFTGDSIQEITYGGEDLHGRVVNYRGLLMAGIEGSLRYRDGPHQYTHFEMWLLVLRLVPSLMLNRLQHGRYLDVLITHAPSEGVHDDSDLPHQGIRAFSWLIKVFQPAYHFHGHVHVYRPDTVTETVVGRTCVINTYGYRETVLKHRCDNRRLKE